MSPPAPRPPRPRPASVDDVLATLTASGVLETLDIAAEDLAGARADSDLVETLATTYELLMAFDDAGVLDTFFRLSKGDQANFLRWIGSTGDQAVRRHRTETFVAALQTGPLGPHSATGEVRDRHAR